MYTPICYCNFRSIKDHFWILNKGVINALSGQYMSKIYNLGEVTALSILPQSRQLKLINTPPMQPPQSNIVLAPLANVQNNVSTC